jgi:hypothetical protein
MVALRIGCSHQVFFLCGGIVEDLYLTQQVAGSKKLRKHMAGGWYIVA